MTELNNLLQETSWNTKIKILRTMKNLSQYEMAKRCGTNQKHYWEWENGYSYPRKTYRNIIAKVLEVPEESIFKDSIK